MAYIDKDKALEICEKHYQHCLEMHDYCGDSTTDNIKEDIERLPTADVVEVVRCKDCKHRNPYGYKCLRDNLWHDTDDFCSYGKRKE